jgi:DNA-binding NarL/FixJ family response regulator
MTVNNVSLNNIESFIDANSVDLAKLDNISVLIVDDCHVSSFRLREILRTIHITNVELCHSYLDAVQLCKANDYKILILDYHLEQDINGSELYELLISKNYLASYCSIITLSSDNSSQTVMNALAKVQGSYLTKPTNSKVLTRKMKQAYASYKIQREIFRLERAEKYNEAIDLAIKYSIKNNFNTEMEFYILGFYEKHKTTNELINLCTHEAFSNRANFICKKIEVEYQNDVFTAAEYIKKLSLFIKNYPNHVRAFDLLSDAFTQIHNEEQGIKIAKKALELTPAVKFRALKLSRLSIKTMDIDSLSFAGRLLAKNLTISEYFWSSLVAEYLCYAESFFQNSKKEDDKTALVQLLREFRKLSSRKLLKEQNEQLDLLFMISQCRLDIIEGNPHAAKVDLGLKLFEHMTDCSELDSVVLVDSLVILYILGEFRLFILFFNTIRARKEKGLYCKRQLDFFSNKSGIVKAVANSSKLINEASSFLATSNYEQALPLYAQVIKESPYSSEACLGYLDCHIKLNIDIPKNLVPQIAAISYIKLPAKQEQWRENILRALSINKKMVDDEINLPSVSLNQQAEILRKLHQVLVFP